MNFRTTDRPARPSRNRPPLRRPPPRAALCSAWPPRAPSWSTSSPAGEPAAQADAQTESVSIAEQLGIPAEPDAAADAETPSRRSSSWPPAAASATPSRPPPRRPGRPPTRPSGTAAPREAARAEARRAARRPPCCRGRRRGGRPAAEAARRPQAAAAQAGRGPPRRPPRGVRLLPGLRAAEARRRRGEFSCLENLWGKESGWNPNAQNPTQHRVRHPAVPGLHLGRHRDRQDVGRLPPDRRRA